MDELRSRKVFLSFANATDVFHKGEMPIPAGLVHLWFSSTAEFGMAALPSSVVFNGGALLKGAH